MNKILRALKTTSTIIGAILLIFFAVGSAVWGFDFENIRYGNSLNSSSLNLENEGPFVTENDSSFYVRYIKGNAEEGFHIEERIEAKSTYFTLNYHYFIDSSDASFKLKPITDNEAFVYNEPRKIIAISDIESNYKTFRDFLLANKVIDKELNWIFGDGHLVLNGDFIDRSYFTTQVLWFIYKLEQEAEKNGGKVHYILGNHEIMNIHGDHRYAKSKYNNIASILGLHQRQLYDSTMHLGRWLNTKNVCEKIGPYMFVHAGISPELVDAKISIRDINKISKENYHRYYTPLKNHSIAERNVLSTKTGPYWYRGYFEDDLDQTQIEGILNFYECSNIIVGHTIQDNVDRFFDDKVIGIDVNHPQDHYNYFPRLQSQGLLIEDGRFFRIDDEGNQVEI